MPNEELEQQDKQDKQEEHKEETKKTLKTVITSVICTLLFVVILLLITILCLKNCSSRSNGDNTSSSSSSNEPEWTDIYNNKDIDDAFKAVVNEYLFFNLGGYQELEDVMSVTYTTKDNNKVDLAISVTKKDSNAVYYYKGQDVDYAGYTDFLDYLTKRLEEVKVDTTGTKDMYLDVTASIDTLEKISGAATSKEQSRYVVAKTLSATPTKHVFGSYYNKQDYKYYVYDKVDYTDGSDPFLTEGQIVFTNNLLYGYYRSLYSLVA